MSRTAQVPKTNVIAVGLAAAVILAFGGTGIWSVTSKADRPQTVTNAQHQTVQLSYQGKNGVDALTLLKQKARVTTKHYSFGDLVTSIDGTAGNGPKYWTFYVNNKEAAVGASAYKTKSSDTIMWKLQ